MNRIVLNIDKVTLTGVDPSDRDRVVGELRESLVRQLSEPDAADRLSRLGHRASLRVPASPPAEAGSVGQSAGRAIGRALTP